MNILQNLYPERVFCFFEELTRIPRGSGDTKRISDYLVEFAEAHGLEHWRDEVGNVVMAREASEGYEDEEPVIIQGHMDMVCEKEDGCPVDFRTDALPIYVQDGYVRSRGTTLGGDDGIAIAYALAILESDEISHPRIEFVATVDEEVGMTGASAIDLSQLSGHRMLNIDSDEEGVFITGCAGGVSLHVNIPVTWEKRTGRLMEIRLGGLSGGHSGSEIHRERGNADILMGRLLAEMARDKNIAICSLSGGRKDNAIPRECSVEILVDAGDVSEMENRASEIERTLGREFASSDPDIFISCEECDDEPDTYEALDGWSTENIIRYLRLVPDGVIHRCQGMPQLVETSSNLGIMELRDDNFFAVNSVRSNVASRRDEVQGRIETLADMFGGSVTAEGAYPAWERVTDSPLCEKIAAIYEKTNGEKPIFTVIHAGLECGILSEKIKSLDCVSFGPENLEIHTPNERLNIESVGRVWDFIVSLLEKKD
ncbi:MAG: beta-Ala-His dipeptidase [Clostridiales bacterium]|nr:beta-Ala-His dipeptidase [Clostridiales bacterium]